MKQPALTAEQQAALTYLRSNPEAVRQFLVLLTAEHCTMLEQYEAVKEALVFNEDARGRAQVLHGKLLALQAVRQFFEQR